MSVTLSIDGPHFTSGQIKFSDIRSKFGGGNNFGSYKRNTDTDATDPIVPDATENSTISTGNDLKFSQFRGSVKSYTATQSGTDENTSTATWPGFRMGNYYQQGQGGVNGPDYSGILWNGNLNKNIKKTVNITGTCGSRTTTHPAAQLDPGSAVYNLTINVLSGARILGAGGSGGIANSANGRNGGNGGIGLRVYNTEAKNLIVSVKSGALVAGGGGGGGAGTVGGTGGQGGDGLADGGTTTVYDDQGACTSFRNCYNICFGGSGYVCTGLETIVSQNCNINYINKGCTAIPDSNNHGVPRNVDNADTPTTGGIGGPGGNGGNGGNGEGYDGTDLSGGLGVGAVTDWPGKTGGTNAGNGGPGGTGGNGGKGGEFGKNGDPGKRGNTGDPGADGNVTGGSPGTAGGLPVGNGGIAGKAIDGLNYILNPSPPPSGTIRGTI